MPALEFKRGDAEKLPFPDQSFDAVINVQGGTAAWTAAGKALAEGEHRGEAPRIAESEWTHAGGYSYDI